LDTTEYVATDHISTGPAERGGENSQPRDMPPEAPHSQINIEELSIKRKCEEGTAKECGKAINK
jgi:hypothetical protein